VSVDRERPGLLPDARGGLTTEYVVLVGTVALVVVAALISIGPRLVADFEKTRDATIHPMP
jgi:Flp pilus assembly pilin Flp